MCARKEAIALLTVPPRNRKAILRLSRATKEIRKGSMVL